MVCIGHASFAMEERFIENYMPELPSLSFETMKEMIEQSQKHMKNPDKIIPVISSPSLLREQLYAIIHNEITTMDQCFKISQMYQLLEQKRDEHDILYNMHKKNMDHNYKQAIVMYNKGFRMMATQWLLHAMDNAEEAFICISEKKHDENVLKEASGIFDIIKEVTFAIENE